MIIKRFSPMKKLRKLLTRLIINLLLISTLASVTTYAAGESITVTGTGSTTIAPLIAYWSDKYKKIVQHVNIDYNGGGSGMGLKMLQHGTIGFAASEIPLDKAMLRQHQWTQFVVAISSVEIIYNLPRISGNQLILTGKLVADIYMGKIKYWDDPAIRRINPSLSLPHHIITIVYRSNSSGTSYAFSKWLEKSSVSWFAARDGLLSELHLAANKVGVGSSMIMVNTVNSLKYSIGYVDYNSAKSKNANMASILVGNQQGHQDHLVRPGLLSAYAALVNVDFSEVNSGGAVSLTNLPGINSWPIIMATYAMVQTKQINTSKNSKNKLKDVLTFFLWSLSNGGAFAQDLNYIPVPPAVTNRIIKQWRNNVPSINITSLVSQVRNLPPIPTDSASKYSPKSKTKSK